jgi:hypothetical protein
MPSRRRPSSWSDLGHAAVDEELDAGDVAAFVGSEEGDHFGDFVQGSRTPEGYSVYDAVGVLFDLFFRHALARQRPSRRSNWRSCTTSMCSARSSGDNDDFHNDFLLVVSQPAAVANNRSIFESRSRATARASDLP